MNCELKRDLGVNFSGGQLSSKICATDIWGIGVRVRRAGGGGREH